jgi:hypothetical protein
MSLFLAPETWPFAVASLLILGIAVIEGMALLIGTSVAGWLDNLHHSPDAPDAPDSWLGWLQVGKVPLLILAIVFLALFALAGFALNLAAMGVFGALIPPLVTAPVGRPRRCR